MLKPNTHTLQISFVQENVTTYGTKVKIGFGHGASAMLSPNHILAKKATVGLIVTFTGTVKANYSETSKKCFINYTIDDVIEMGFNEQTTKFDSIPDREVKEIETQTSTNSVGKV